jgi:hypothetical protein
MTGGYLPWGANESVRIERGLVQQLASKKAHAALFLKTSRFMAAGYCGPLRQFGLSSSQQASPRSSATRIFLE